MSVKQYGLLMMGIIGTMKQKILDVIEEVTKRRDVKVMRCHYPPLLIVVFALLLVQTGQAEEANYGLLWVNQGGKSVAISSDGSYIATSSNEGLLVFNQEGKLLHKYEQGRRAKGISISADGSYMAIMCYGFCFSNRERGYLWSYKTGGNVQGVAISSDGYYIAVGSCDGKVYFFNREGKLLWSYKITDKKQSHHVNSISISSDGSYIAAGSRDPWLTDTKDDRVYFFNREGELLWSYKMSYDGIVDDVSISSNGLYVAAGSKDNKLYFFNQEGELLWCYKTCNRVRSVSVSSNGSYIAAGSWDDKVYLFNQEGELLWSYKTRDYVESVSISSDGYYIAAGSKDNKVYLFDRKGELLLSYETGGDIDDVSISSDGSYTAAGSKDGKVYFFSTFQGIAGLMEKVKNVVESESSKGFNVAKADALLSQAEQAMNRGNYKIAYDLAKEAKSHALDIDQDGISNDTDFNPTINNYLIYAGTIVILIGSVITLRTGLNKVNKVRLKRQHLAEVKHMKEKAKGLYQESMKQEILDMIEEATTSAPSNHPPQPQEILDMIEDTTEEGG